MQLSEQELVRREKLTKLRELGIDPYPADLFPVQHFSNEIIATYSEGQEVVIAGRLMSRRIQGKASFAELQDAEGRIQVYFNRDEICLGEDKTKYNEVYKKLLDIGDIIGMTKGGYHTDEFTTSTAVRWLRAKSPQLAQQKQPWFLSVNLVNPHDVMFFNTDAPGADPVQNQRHLMKINRAPD